MVDEAKLRAFGALIVRLQLGGDLTREEAREAFRQIWRNEVTEISQGAFIAALRCKGETQDEIAGVADSHNVEWDLHLDAKARTTEPVLGIVGVGMDSFKTVNVSSGAAVLAAACGAYVHKVGAPGMTGVSGSAQVFALMGVDTEGPYSRALEAVRDCRLGFTSVVGEAMHKTGIFRVLSQLRCGTSIHIAGPMGFHGGERHKIIGVPLPEQIMLVCKGLKALGYKRALVPCGNLDEHPDRHIDEISNVGTTQVAELHEDGSIEQYEITPEACDIERAHCHDIAAETTMEGNVRKMLRALVGKEPGPVADLLALNAASALKLMGRASTLSDGVHQARNAIFSGQAQAQIEALIRTQNRDPDAGLAQFTAMIAD